MEWNKLVEDAVVEKTAEALRKRGMEVTMANSSEEAKKKVLELIPEGAEVGSGSSTTLNEAGITKEIDESGRYDSVRKKLMAIADEKQRAEARRKSYSPKYGLGSVQAITQDGQLVAASASGSQLSLYVYGAEKLILVVSTNKIVKDIDEAIRRINEYVLPLESERVKKAYNMPGSNVNKILIIEKERPGRITLILVKQKLGF
jgi:L-lactate utilization protein LutC